MRAGLILNRGRGPCLALALAGLLAGFGLGSCVTPAKVESLSELAPGEMLVMGRIELLPALAADEQKLSALGGEQYRNRVIFALGERGLVLEKAGLGDANLALTADLGDYFYAKRPQSAFLIYSAPHIWLDFQAQARLKLPAGLRYEFPADAKAVYLAGIRYHRDVYNSITKIEIVDDFKKASELFQARFGTRITLVKAEIKQVK